MVIYWVAGSIWTVTCCLAVGQKKKRLILHHVSMTDIKLFNITLPIWKYVSLGSVVTCNPNLSVFKGCQRVIRVSVWEGERRTLRRSGTFLWTFYRFIYFLQLEVKYFFKGNRTKEKTNIMALRLGNILLPKWMWHSKQILPEIWLD